jgi:hypothetical protein
MSKNCGSERKADEGFVFTVAFLLMLVALWGFALWKG